MKKIILGIFMMLSSIIFANSNISGPKVYVGGGIGLGTQYVIQIGYAGIEAIGLDLDINSGPIWKHKIDERNSIDFGPIFSLSLKNHVVLDDEKTYIGQLVAKASMSFDYNIKNNEKTTIYLGAKLGGGAYIYWYEEDIISRNVVFANSVNGVIDFDIHVGAKLNNDTLRIGGSIGTKGLIFEVGKIF